LILWGTNDQVNNISAGHDLADGIAGSRLITYEGVGHGLPQEAPERFTRDVIEFLER
jgi:pimeloyl-ACP methyl ester carboxylesterase